MTLNRESGHGRGRATLKGLADEAVFSELSYRYPLKLLSPRTFSTANGLPCAIAYMLSYGGGLVSGDFIELDVSVGSGTALMLLTQVQCFSYPKPFGKCSYSISHLTLTLCPKTPGFDKGFQS